MADFLIFQLYGVAGFMGRYRGRRISPEPGTPVQIGHYRLAGCGIGYCARRTMPHM